MTGEQPAQAPHHAAPPQRHQARVHRRWWPGWIWGIPVAALAVVGWLGVRTLLSGKEAITIRFDDAHDLKPNNSNVEYRGTIVGTVTAVKLDADGDAVTVTASIDDSATRFLRSGTRFWLEGANPSLSNPSSLGAILSGPTIEMEPGAGTKSSHFVGLDRKPIGPSSGEQPVLYEVSFDGDVGALKSGDPVKLHGFTVGEVRDVSFSYNPQSGELSMPGTIALYPSLFHIQAGSRADTPAQLAAAMTTLVQKGLRARLDQDPPLVGSYRVSLEMVPGAPAVRPAMVDGLPQLPAESGGGLTSIVTRINKLPIEQIARNVLDMTHHADTLVASPHLKDAITQLDGALEQIHRITASASPQVTELIAHLRRAADDLDATVQSAHQLVGGTATQNGLNSTVDEVTEAARAVRSLANFLDRNPTALIRGRSDEGP